jgi:hypothetical protein
MDCQQARETLLNADDLRSARTGSTELGEHLGACAACELLAVQLKQLEQGWRDLPTPVEADSSRCAFLNRLKAPTVAPAPERTRRLTAPLLRWTVAAALFIGIGTAAWFLVPTPQAVAGPPLLELLVDWNLELADAGSLSERSRIYEAQQGALQQAVRKLPVEEQELASLLLDNGSRLAAQDDPIGEAERFSNVADRLVEKLQSAAQGKDQQTVDRYVRLQTQVAKRGVGDRLAKVEESGALNFDAERRLEKVILRDSKRMKQLVDLLEREPDLKRKDIRQELEIPTKLPRQLAELVFEFEVRDRPVVVGQPTAFRVHLANRSKSPLAKLQLVVTVPDEFEVRDPKGPNGYRRDGQHLIFRPLTTLQAGQEASFEVQVKPLRSGDVKWRAELRSKQSGYRPVLREIGTAIVAESGH